MIRPVMLTLALLASPAMIAAQQPASPIQGQAPANDTSKAKPKHMAGKHKAAAKKGAKPAAKPAEKDTSKSKP